MKEGCCLPEHFACGFPYGYNGKFQIQTSVPELFGNSSMKLLQADAAAISYAADMLRQGGLVAFPTETVYGLGADASNPEAVAAIFKAKGRPADHPLIVHIGQLQQLQDWAREVPEAAYLLAERFWPGPLTLILNKRERVSELLTGGQQTVGLRIPGHAVALRLLKEFAGGIAAPSANRFGRISPTCARHVAEELDDRVDVILDGGACQIGLESTIIDLSSLQPVLLRPGAISRRQIEELLQTELLQQSRAEVRAPGMLAVHYAPVTPAMICIAERLQETIQRLTVEKQQRIGVLTCRQPLPENPDVHAIHLSDQAEAYARALYAAMRKLDALHLDAMLIEKPPETEAWRAVHDRLRKATVGEA